MKYQFIAAHQREYPVKTMRRILEVAVSGYFAWLRGWGSVLCGSIRPIARSTAVRAFTRCCERDQEHCGRKRVARLMREQGLSAKPRTHRVRTTDSQHEHPVAPNLLNRDGTRECAQYQVGGWVPGYHWGVDMAGLALSRGRA
jgi:hypothetical protein